MEGELLVLSKVSASIAMTDHNDVRWVDMKQLLTTRTIGRADLDLNTEVRGRSRAIECNLENECPTEC